MMMKGTLFFVWLFGGLLAPHSGITLVSAQTYSCPGITANPVVVAGPTSSFSSFTRSINKSVSNTVCVLLRIKPRSDSVNMNSITRESSNDDFDIVPVARSFNNQNWERVAGPYAQDLRINNCCSVAIPNLPNLDGDNGKFVLLSFSNELSSEEIVSRFLQQTTFGPTLEMINSWNYNQGSMEQQMGKWLSNQMNTNLTPPTYHREYFRERTDFSTWNEAQNYFYRPRHPCEKYARWREFAFTTEDYAETPNLEVTRWNGKFLLKVDDVPRTVMNTWKDSDEENIGTGLFYFCYFTEEKLYGEVLIGRVGSEDECIAFENPPVNIPAAVKNNKITRLSLPSRSNFGSIEPITFQDSRDSFFGEALYLKSDISTNQCNNIDKDGWYSNILGTFPNGNQVWYGGHIQLDENTLENPIADGGVAMYSVSSFEDNDAVCPVASKSFVNIDTCYLSTKAGACSSAHETKRNDHVVVCGSPGEKENNPLQRNTFSFFEANKVIDEPERQKKDVSNAIFLQGKDQFRQRMAWALAQILVVTPKQINEDGYSEIYLNYHDIFVRNAFGNYFDILKEVSYSPMMAEMLSYLNSKSSTYVLETTGSKSFPDENYAREIMQLFSIGIHKLNIDGTKILDDNGAAILSYSNTDIQNFARTWTGFVQQNLRSNIEMEVYDENNRMDPMRIQGMYRDPFPKTNLIGGHIGDKTPLCVDLADKHFLKKGATYRLLGSSLKPDLYESGEEDKTNNVLVLTSSSNLKSRLSSKQTKITLDETILCSGDECNVDTMRLVQIQQNPNIYYEYVHPPCVELPFYETGKKISTEWLENSMKKSMCANQELATAYDACCENPSSNKPEGVSLCYYDHEKTTYSSAKSRCKSRFPNGDTCDFYWLDEEEDKCTTISYWMPDNWFWTDEDCSVKVKVNEDGLVAIIHQPPLLSDHPDFTDTIDLRVHPDSTEYFKVHWDSNTFPNSSNSCGTCESVYRGCLCNINVLESSVFSSLPTENDIITQLHIGAFDPQILGSYNQVPNTGNVKVWHKNGGYSQNTIFEISYQGKQTFLKNIQSIVKIEGTQNQFRNPPSFINLAYREPFMAHHETDAVLENYFYNNNVAPFLAMRIIQKFGISNPSPLFIERVATAFKNGSYPNPDPQSENFGDGVYGNLEAMAAAIVLDIESRSIILDADPTSGSLVEPMLKLTRFLRAMEFQTNNESGERIRMKNLQSRIGQEPHSFPNVFSFFLPEYAAPGHIKAASITSPEAQVLSGPKVVSFMNGILSLIDLGLSECYSGFGEESAWQCDLLESYYDNSDTEFNHGRVKYQPSTPNNAEKVVDELSLLLTAGRLNSASRSLLVSAFQSEGNKADGLRVAQKLIASTPEFHSTTTFRSKSNSRPEIETPQASANRYKAIVFIMLDGGCDSYNMLIPNSGCSGSGKTSYNHYNSVRGGISIPQIDLLPIDASGSSQVCSSFGLHPNLPHLKSLYDDGDLLWVANMGVLQEYVTENNWEEKTEKTALFAHNIQYSEVHKMDIYDRQPGRGVGGRMADVLLRNGFSPGSVSVNGISEALISGLNSLFVLDPFIGVEKFNPIPWAQSLWNTVKKLNKVTKLGSNLFGETWANLLFQAVGENELLFDSLKSTSLSTTFPTTDLGNQMELVAKLMKSKDSRGTDRDLFYVNIGGFDTHSNIAIDFAERTQVINSGLQAFTTEMKAQGMWDDVTVVMVSEFARTLSGNTGAGSDHAWGGHYFVAGGEISGKKILGKFPDILSEDGPLIIQPGIAIPTLSWDSLWNGIAQWFGITDTNDLNEILPNRNIFVNDLFSQNDLYSDESPTPPTPTPPTPTPPTPTPPTPTPPTGEIECQDSPFRFKVVKDGKKIARNCLWVETRATQSRCKLDGVSEQCPSTCNTCSDCVDSFLRVKFKYNGKNISRDCKWVKQRNTKGRCKISGMEHTCRDTCGTC